MVDRDYFRGFNKMTSFDVAKGFRLFCDNLVLSSDKLRTISNRYHNITKIINRNYWNSTSDVAHSLYVGSYGRGTKVNDSDVDILVMLPAKLYHQYNRYSVNGQSAFLQDVRNTIRVSYPSTEIRADGQIIGVNFSDDKSFEVLPAFENSDGYTFTYADTNDGGSWKITNPRAEIKAVNDMDKATNGNYKRLCKMARSWKSKNNVDISGIVIDILAHRFIDEWDYKENGYTYYDWMTRDFMEYLMNFPQQVRYMVMGSNRYVYDYGNFQYKAKLSYNKAVQAIDYGSEYSYLANQVWRDIYGTRFPNI